MPDADIPELLNVKVSGEYEFIHRSNSRGTTNYISLDSSIAKYGGVVVTEGDLTLVLELASKITFRLI